MSAAQSDSVPRREVALNEIAGNTDARHADRRASAPPRHRPGKAVLTHQPLDPLATDRDALGAQVAVGPRRAVGAAASHMQLAHPLEERLVAERARATAADSPRRGARNA